MIRRPLPPSAKRAGWVGCNILLDQIPALGKISLIEAGRIVAPETVHVRWRKTAFIGTEKAVDMRGWTLVVLKCIEMLKSRTFSLQELYCYESMLATRHPGNKHIKEKIRQQLQVLRDKGILEFRSSGNYELIGE